MTEPSSAGLPKGDPLTDEERKSLPVFPLPRVVLFPGAVLPLHLFEPRYRELMEDCLADGPMAIAIALLAPGWEEDYEGHPAVHTVAGVGRIIDHHRRPDGRFDVVLLGVGRYRLEELPSEGRSYRRCSASFLADRSPHPEAIERLVTPALATAATVSALVRQRYPEFELGIDRDSAPGFIADRIADRLVPDIERRQELLETVDVKRRLALAQDALVDLLAHLQAGGAAN